MSTNQYPESWKWDETGDKITGIVTDQREVDTKYGPATVLEVRSEDHEMRPFSVWCTAKALRNFLSDLHPAPGDRVSIQRVGKEEWVTKDGEARSMWVYDYAVLNRAGQDEMGNPVAATEDDDNIPF